MRREKFAKQTKKTKNTQQNPKQKQKGKNSRRRKNCILNSVTPNTYNKQIETVDI